jgi:hypothetical protein
MFNRRNIGPAPNAAAVAAAAGVAPGQKIDFNKMPIPAGYTPGLGRGAQGFTTRSDIGSAKAPAGGVPGAPPQVRREKRREREGERARLAGMGCAGVLASQCGRRARAEREPGGAAGRRRLGCPGLWA